MDPISRRTFVALTAGSLMTVSPVFAALPASALTAQDVADRIKSKTGGEWRPDTVDSFKAGNPSTRVTGIVTTALPSLQVLAAAAKAGANMVITCEPTYYSRADTPTPPVRRFPGAAPPPQTPAPPDPVFTGKTAFIDQHNMVVYRLFDHWRTEQPDPYVRGLASALGWSSYASKTDPSQLTVPAASLDAVVQTVRQKLGSRGGIRVIGDPHLNVRTIGLLPGSTPLQAAITLLPQVDVMIAGEVREWETVEYVRDTVALGGKKALIYVGRTVSEDPGMKVCAEWLRTFLPELPVTWHSAGDPYWRPAA